MMKVSGRLQDLSVTSRASAEALVTAVVAEKDTLERGMMLPSNNGGVPDVILRAYDAGFEDFSRHGQLDTDGLEVVGVQPTGTIPSDAQIEVLVSDTDDSDSDDEWRAALEQCKRRKTE